MTIKWHKVEPFNFFYCLCSDAEWRQWYKKKKIPLPEVPVDYFGYTIWSGSYAFVVLDPDKNKKPYDAVGTLIHEGVHIYQACMKYVGESATGIEMEAYSIEAIAINLIKDHDAIYAKRPQDGEECS